MLKDKTIMITGGTGSFGNAVLKNFIKTDVSEIRVFSRDEKKQEEMRLSINSEKVKFFIGDIRSYESIHDALNGVNYIFHAAALKQVPSCEFYPMEAVQTNVLGSDNVMRAAISKSVERVILLSTDKSVYPINAMGMTKALMERNMVAKSRLNYSSGPIFCATRYGNVMASRGSVIPLFVKQILNNEPITITDPNMTRFLMSLDDSVNLVRFAFENARSGDILIQKAPSSTIYNLALALKHIFSSNTEIKLIGTRHGEKLFESLLSREEMVKAIDLDKYYCVPMDNRNLNYNKYFIEGNESLSEIEDYTSHNTYRMSVKELIKMLEKLDYIKAILNS